VTRADIATAVQELQWVEYAARPHRHSPEPAHSTTAVNPVLQMPGSSLGHLLVATDGRTVREVTLRPGRLIVGRTPDNDVQIDSRFVSRHHCQVITTEHSCVIEDLNSTNGIYVKSNRVRRHYLNDGDVVLVGKHELIYVDERPARSRTAPRALPEAAPADAEDLVEEAGAAPGARAPVRQP